MKFLRVKRKIAKNFEALKQLLQNHGRIMIWTVEEAASWSSARAFAGAVGIESLPQGGEFSIFIEEVRTNAAIVESKPEQGQNLSRAT